MFAHWKCGKTAQVNESIEAAHIYFAINQMGEKHEITFKKPYSTLTTRTVM